MPSRAILLVLCPDVGAYIDAVEASIRRRESEPCLIPIIGSDASTLHGFPTGIRTVRHHDSEAWHETDEHGDVASVVAWQDPEPGLRCCISADDPICKATARLLAFHSGRRVTCVDDPDAWERELSRLFDLDATESVALCIPGWTADHSKPSPHWLKRTLMAMRSLRSAVGNRSWGIITGPTAAVMTHVVAKSLLHHGVAERYASSSAFLLTPEDCAEGPIPRYAENLGQRPFHAFDRAALEDRSVLRLTELPASLLVVSSHGRSYCACHGLLCGARRIDGVPEASVERCVLGMDCADPKFFRVDPRRYDVPLLVLDACSSADWGSPVWDTGIPAIAYHALAGAASAVLTGDGFTAGPVDDAFDLFWAVLTSSTLGDAASRLNSVRPYAAGDYPYFLLGDPDILSGPRRFEGWVNEPLVIAEAGAGQASYRCTLENLANGAFFQRVRLPVAAEAMRDHTLYITAPGAQAEAVSLIAQYRHANETELWFRSNPSETPDPIELRMIGKASPSLPRSLVECAANVEQLVASWSDRVPSEHKAALVMAARSVAEMNGYLELVQARATVVHAAELETAVADALDAWRTAQRKCVEALLEYEDLLWPLVLWRSRNYQSRIVDTPCPFCSLAPMLERVYDSPPAPARIWSECYRCGITSDRPLIAGCPTVTVDAPLEVTYGFDYVAKISVACSPSELWSGAGVVALGGTEHGVVPDPASFEIKCDGTTTLEQRIRLTLPEPPPIAHSYRLQVIMLLNNHWFLTSRVLMVRRDTSPV